MELDAVTSVLFFEPFFGIDHDHAIGGSAAVQGCSRRTAEHADAFNIFRIDVGDKSPVWPAPEKTSSAWPRLFETLSGMGIPSITYNALLLLLMDFAPRNTTLAEPPGPAEELLMVTPATLPSQAVYEVGIFHLVHFVAFYFLHIIGKRLGFTGNTECGHNHLIHFTH